MRGLAVAAAAALALGPGCRSDDPATCPGEAVGTYDFAVTGTRPACSWPEGTPPPVAGAFRGTLSSDAALGTAALCVEGRGDLAQPYFGRVEDGAYALEADGGLAVLGRCGSNCAARVVLRIAGAADAAGFTGTLTERFDDSQGDCGACSFPCDGSYTLTGTPQGDPG